VDGRALYNLTVEEFDKGVDLNQVKSKYAAEDPNRVVVWSGTGVALMSVIKPAKDIVLEVHQECVASLRGAQTLITSAS
jgi:nitronate monooxygenase